jgi:hypothetical protein
MTDPAGLQWRAVMKQRVGGFFRNTFRAPGLTCLYCTGPSPTELCTRCSSHRSAFGDQLADQVVTLTYAQDRHPAGEHQSRRTAYAYKQTPPATTCVADMQLMTVAATFIHGRCIASLNG